jgi:hypothetical protein
MEIMAPELDNVSGRLDWVGTRREALRRKLDFDTEDPERMASSSASMDRHPAPTAPNVDRA